MERRYQVFVSSTFQDLANERLEVIKALLELDCIPCGMEYFPAASEETWTYIQGLITDCDYYVLIIGGRYGSLTADGISYTQKEYEYALSQGVPTIAFIHANPGDLPAKKTELSAEGRGKLEGFIARARKHLCKDWTTADQLGAVVSRSLTQLIKRHPRAGWVKADQLSSQEATEEILLLTRKVRELEKDLVANLAAVPAGSEELAQGDEKLTLGYEFKAMNYSKRYAERESGRFKASVEVTWNQVFSRIAPLISMGATETTVKNGLGRLITEKVDWSKKRLPKGSEADSVSVNEDALNRLKIQFLGLGYMRIEKAEHSSVLRWVLTKLGEERMFSLLSVKRSQLPDAST